MNRHTIQILAAMNILAAAVLFVWFRLLPHPGDIGLVVQRLADESQSLDAQLRWELARQMRDAWRHRGDQLFYWSLLAGSVVLLNAGVFFFHAVRAESRGRPHG